MVLIESKILQNSMTLDIDQVTVFEQLLLSKQRQTMSVRGRQCCLIRLFGRLCEQQTVNCTTVIKTYPKQSFVKIMTQRVHIMS